MRRWSLFHHHLLQEEALPGTWFEAGASLWVWLDRDGAQFCGPDLADTLLWCEAGQQLRVDWNTYADLEVLAALRGGLGESYRRSLFALLSAAPQGLTFRELVEALRARQGHAIHRGTIRALLSVGRYVRREGRWSVVFDDETGARQLRVALVQTLLPPNATAGEHRLELAPTAQSLQVMASALFLVRHIVACSQLPQEVRHR